MNAITNTSAQTKQQDKRLTYEVKPESGKKSNQLNMIVKKDGIVVNTVVFLGISPKAAYFYEK